MSAQRELLNRGAVVVAMYEHSRTLATRMREGGRVGSSETSIAVFCAREARLGEVTG